MVSHSFWAQTQVLESINKALVISTLEKLFSKARLHWKELETWSNDWRRIYALIYFWLQRVEFEIDPAQRNHPSLKCVTSVGFKTMTDTSFSTATDWSHMWVAQAALFASYNLLVEISFRLQGSRIIDSLDDWPGGSSSCCINMIIPCEAGYVSRFSSCFCS